MFIHILAGIGLFASAGELLGYEITFLYLTIGAVAACLPDILSIHKLTVGKWAHKHRDGFHHSIFFAPTLFIILALFFPAHLPFVTLLSLTVLSHPLLDLYGIGWGVQLFYPFTNKTYTVCYNGRLLYVFPTPEDRAKEVEAKEDLSWLEYINPSLNKPIRLEYMSLLGVVIILVNFFN
jgi:membrane-bound metal-dependent hydrolase YbcI (DUF457 family)